MRQRAVLAVVALAAAVSAAEPARQTPAARARAAKLADPTQLIERAPDTYRARFETSRGSFVIAVTRDWAPFAADRFYNLVKNGFYDDSRFFRVLSGFMAQFGLHADPAVQGPWRDAGLPDEPPVQSNLRGYVSFARESGPNSRFTMVFVNYKDNSYLDKEGFPPFGQVVMGMETVDKLYSEYGRTNIPDQRRITREGNPYLLAEYPKLDFVRRAIISK